MVKLLRVLSIWLGPMASGLLLSACASSGYSSVSPADLPRLEEEVRSNPGDGLATLRLAAAQQAAGDCDGALETAGRGMQLRPQDALGPLVAGECLEDRGEVEAALEIYDAYTAEYGNGLGAPAVAARAMLVRRRQAAGRAREMLANEVGLGTEVSSPDVVAVMPLEVIGDEAYEPLSLGLASMITSDLALLQQLTIVERAQLDALVRELRLVEAGAVDARTAVRAGRMLRAGLVAHGLTHVAPDEGLRLEVGLMDQSSRIVGIQSVSGRLRDLFDLEKDLVLGLVEEMGYPLSEVERVAILENGTRSLSAFLAYSRGLVEEDRGDYSAASREYAAAVRADPGFRLARDAYGTTSAATAVQQTGAGGTMSLAATQVTTPSTPGPVDVVGSALTSGVLDMSPTLTEVLAGNTTGTDAVATSTSAAPGSTTATVAAIAALFNFRLVLRLP